MNAQQRSQSVASEPSGREVQVANRAALDAVRVRRDAFLTAVLALEGAVEGAVTGTPAEWAETLARPVRTVRGMLGEHVRGTEAPGGFFEEVVIDAPGLAHAVDRLRAEHVSLVAGADELAAALTTVRDDADVERARELARALVRELLGHRQRGADLVYDAYNVEIATGD